MPGLSSLQSFCRHLGSLRQIERYPKVRPHRSCVMCLSGIDTPANGMPGLKLLMYICVCSRVPSLHTITCQIPHEAHHTLTLDLKTEGVGTSPDACFRDSPSGAVIKHVVFETVSQPLPVYSLFYVYKSYECAIEIDQKMCLKNLTCLETKARCPREGRSCSRS